MVQPAAANARRRTGRIFEMDRKRADRVRGYMADLSDTIDNWTLRVYGSLTVPSRELDALRDSVLSCRPESTGEDR